MDTEFKHLCVDLLGCECDFSLDDDTRIRDILKEVTRIIEVDVLDEFVHKFKPQGTTIIFSLSESHLAYHSWPEHKTAFIDIFSCGKKSPELAMDFIEKTFRPKKVVKKILTRKAVEK